MQVTCSMDTAVAAVTAMNRTGMCDLIQGKKTAETMKLGYGQVCTCNQWLA